MRVILIIIIIFVEDVIMMMISIAGSSIRSRTGCRSDALAFDRKLPFILHHVFDIYVSRLGNTSHKKTVFLMRGVPLCRLRWRWWWRLQWRWYIFWLCRWRRWQETPFYSGRHILWSTRGWTHGLQHQRSKEHKSAKLRIWVEMHPAIDPDRCQHVISFPNLGRGLGYSWRTLKPPWWANYSRM